MQKHDLRDGALGGRYFDFGRPEREIVGALQRLTGQQFDGSEILGVSRSEDPRRQMLQRRLFTRQAARWQTWWETHWREFTDDAAFQKVNLKVDHEPLPPAPTALRPNARVGDGVIGEILSPAIQEGQHADHFYDLDTGSSHKWPAQFPRDEARLDQKQLADWATENGIDLMCVTHRAQDGTQTFVLRSFGMKAWEINPRDLRNLDKLIAAGTLPKGRDVGELLMHYDDASNQAVPSANAAFIYVTRDGSMGLIETTDRDHPDGQPQRDDGQRACRCRVLQGCSVQLEVDHSLNPTLRIKGRFPLVRSSASDSRMVSANLLVTSHRRRSTWALASRTTRRG